MSEATTATIPKPNRLGLWIILIAATGVFSLWMLRSKNEPVTRDRLEAARRLWAQSGPPDYDLEVVVTGRQGATYEVHVRNSEVIEAFRNQAPLTQQRTFRTWSGPGMFDTIGTDVETLEFALAHPDDSRKIMLTLRATFDEKTGLPRSYLRSEWGTNHDVTWKVTRFEVK